MNQIITIKGIGKTKITDKDFLASGGEGSIFIKDGLALKIYNSPNKMIPLTKIKELQAINNPQVLYPKNILYDENGKAIGYAMDFKKGAEPVCKLFTKAFKQRNKVSNEDIVDFIEKMQNVLDDIHKAKCLVVDHNELNVLFSLKKKEPYYIDTDSFETPGSKATAIMESIRDPLVKNNHWTEGSDWYSFAIIVFQMLINIHPFRGSHPNYKPNEWLKRMKDGISVLDPKSSVPPICNDFSVIPPSYMAWFKEVFVKNLRCHPPKIGELAPIISMPSVFNVIASSGLFETATAEEYDENILDVFNYMGINYIIGAKTILKGKATIPVDINGYDKILMCESTNNPVVCKLKDGIMYIEDINGKEVGNIAAKDMMYRNGCIYTVNGIKLIENSFIQLGEKVIHSIRQSGNVLELATQVFDGVIFQDFTGKKHITLPYEKGKCTIMHIPELDGYRILHARSEKNVCGVMAEKSGIYYCFVMTFNENFSGYTLRTTKDVAYSEINLTVLSNGVAVMANNSTAEIFKGSNVKVFDNPPFNSTTKLFNYSGSVFYIDGKKIISAKTKK
jgi:serine/threonine protein kinase